ARPYANYRHRTLASCHPAERPLGGHLHHLQAPPEPQLPRRHRHGLGTSIRYPYYDRSVCGCHAKRHV
ncbi:hypothetical protein HKX48_008212, partial [Thoreauomyces humboldtii]